MKNAITIAAITISAIFTCQLTIAADINPATACPGLTTIKSLPLHVQLAKNNSYTVSTAFSNTGTLTADGFNYSTYRFYIEDIQAKNNHDAIKKANTFIAAAAAQPLATRIAQAGWGYQCFYSEAPNAITVLLPS